MPHIFSVLPVPWCCERAFGTVVGLGDLVPGARESQVMRLSTWMLPRDTLGWLGSRVISPTYKWGMWGWHKPLILTFYQHFQRDIQANQPDLGFIDSWVWTRFGFLGWGSTEILQWTGWMHDEKGDSESSYSKAAQFAELDSSYK